MHGRACEDRKRGRHMWTAPSRSTASVKAVGSSSLSLSSSRNSFFKDGRKICVGDCALFKPSENCPPFVGIIRSLAAGKENQLKLGVNWLYRPAEVKLGKDICLEAAPNEVFYSFHKDEIPAASLLHPCRVAFLPKGVELPSGICSFVCRRVYDITNKCLWWLTDQDYIHERQEEVDQLLYKTRSEMHATVQPGGRSPKPMNGPTSASQLKQSSDSAQNNVPSLPSQVKGKKRERVDQGSEPVKRERTSRNEDGDFGHGKSESILKSEIAKITEKGGLVNSEGVDKLVQLILPERNEKKIDLASRSMLAGVVAATDKFDCLSRFVQLRGLPVFDEWLQEVHKGKIGDSSSPKDGEKSLEEFLLVLLRALDKLPVNLNALKMCNIGKSVNLLRTHKNLEIQRKARSLVDMWKKRVEAEMDAKSGSSQGVQWPARPRLQEASHGTIKTSVANPHSSKSSSAKLVQGENNTNSVSPTAGLAKSTLVSGSTNIKDGQPKSTCVGGVSDVPVTIARDEKSSSSSQSLNNSQSYSSDHAKAGGVVGKEIKNSSGSSRHRKSVNGKRETVSSRSSSLQKNSNVASDKLSQSSLTCEKAADVPTAEGNSHKLIVKIPNRGRCPAQSTGSLEDAGVMNSRASSPVLSEKSDQIDRNLTEKSDMNGANVGTDVNTESWQSDDLKDVLTVSDEGGGSPSVVADQERCESVDDSRRVAEAPKGASPSSAKEINPGKLHEACFRSMDALIESCVKYSEVNAPIAIGDDVGMNLLASVAAGEISKYDVVSPTGSLEANENDISQNQSFNGANSENEKQGVVNATVWSKDAERKNIPKPVDDVAGTLDSCGKDLKQALNLSLESNVKSEDVMMATADVPSVSSIDKTLDDAGSKEPKDIKVDGVLDAAHVSDARPNVDGSLFAKAKSEDLGVKVESEAAEKPFSHMVSEMNCSNQEVQKPTAVTSEFVRETDEAALLPSGSRKDTVSRNVDELTERTDEMDASSNSGFSKRQKTKGRAAAAGDQVVTGLNSCPTNNKAEDVGENLGKTEVKEQQSVAPSPSEVPSPFDVKERERNGTEEAEESTCVPGDASSISVIGVSDMDAKVEFDLNEGFSGDDGRNSDLNNFTGPGTSPSTPVQLISRLPIPASVTVAAAAKRPFVPPEDLLRNKGAHGWKGSAATSAFRPAEPRKALEVSKDSYSMPSNSIPVKQARPPLDIDLNVPDERVIEDLASRSSGQASAPVCSGLDLDLNRVDEPPDVTNNYTFNSSHTLRASFQPINPSGRRMTDAAGTRRDFDLNNGPTVDDALSEPSIIFGQHARPTLPSQLPLSGIRVNDSADMGNFSSWFSGSANTYSAHPSILPGRGDHQPFPMGGPQRMLGPTTIPSPFSSDLYRGSVLSSSPAGPFPSTTPFQYPAFPFGASFPLPSTSFSAGSATYMDSSSNGRLVFSPINSQLLGQAYPRSYFVNLTDDNIKSTSSESSRRWFGQDLDLNTGPETEGRTEASSLAPRPLSTSGPQTLTEEQARLFQMSGGVFKRESEGRWDGYKQSSWQ